MKRLTFAAISRVFPFALLALLAACSGGGGSGSSSSAGSGSPTTITTSPANVTVTAGATATFTAAASGNPAPTVQWQQSTDNGASFTNIAGATTASLSFTTTASQNGYQYRAVFTNTSSTATTTAATLSVLANVAVTTNPANASVQAGATATFTAAASGNPAPTVQWQVSTDNGTTFSNVAGATSTSLSFTTDVGQNGYQYRAVFGNGSTTATSSAATLTVLSHVAITTNPSDITVNAGATATFTAAATGNPIPAVQWQVSSDSGATFTNVAGASNASLSFSATAGQNGNLYRAVFTNASSTATTTTATLSVLSNVAVITNPVNASVLVGNTVTFTAAASGNPVPTVQWQVSTNLGVSFTNIVGATSASLSFTVNASQNGYQYRAVFDNGSSTAISTAATLTVLAHVAITTNPTNTTVVSGATATFTAAASGSPAPTVQWQQSTDSGVTFTNMAGATSGSLSFTTSLSQNGYQYRAVFTNSSSAATTTVATLIVTAPGKQWKTPQKIDNVSGSAAFPTESVRATDPNGNVMVIWAQATSNAISIYANRYTPASGTWGTAHQISSATDTAVNAQGQYSLATDASGNALAVWTQTQGSFNSGGVSGIWTSRFDVGTLTWSAPQLIGGNSSPPSVGIWLAAQNPAVAIDASGNAFAVWNQNNGQSSITQNIWAARYTAGVGWGAASAITNDNYASGGYRNIGFDSAGNAVVTYLSTATADIRIKALRYSASSSTWSAPQFIAASTGFSVQEVQLAVAANGDAVAVWDQSDGTNTNTVSNRFDHLTGSWGTEQVIDTNVAGSTAQPQVAVDANGNAWAIWARVTNSQGTHIWTNRLTAGGNWGTPQTIDSGTGQSRYPQIAFDTNGKAMAVWTQSIQLSSGGPYTLIYASYNLGTTWGTPQLLETAGDNSSDPQIVFDASGNATAVWDKFDLFPGVNVTIWADRFE